VHDFKLQLGLLSSVKPTLVCRVTVACTVMTESKPISNSSQYIFIHLFPFWLRSCEWLAFGNPQQLVQTELYHSMHESIWYNEDGDVW